LALVNAVYKLLKRQANLDYLVVEITRLPTADGITEDFTHPDFALPVESKFMAVEIAK
jgi:G3E family GTPase